MKVIKSKLHRQSFSSPEQLRKMAMMVINRWHGVWTEAVHRHQTLTLQQEQKSATQRNPASISKNLQS